MIGRSVRFIGEVRAVDASSARCNFRRFPLPVSGMRAAYSFSQRQWFRIAILCLCAGLAAGIAIGVLGYAELNLHGILP